MNTQARVLQDLSALVNDEGEDKLRAEIEALRAENARLREDKAQARGVSCKVSEKGACSVYGLGRFPVTLYPGQWERLFAHKDQVMAFIDQNRAKFAVKE